MENNEDATVLRMPSGQALVQSLDFFTPIVNDPYAFGQIAAANALSDIYAMGGVPWCAMNIVCFPIKSMDKEILHNIIRGGYDKVRESGALLAGGHSLEDDEVKYGLSVSGFVDPEHVASNANLHCGDRLILTKPLGLGVLATAIKAKWDNYEALEQTLYHWAAHLNDKSGAVLRAMQLQAATDITGFGLGGHMLEMAQASRKEITLWAENLPLIPEAVELANMGLLPAGSHANHKFCHKRVHVADNIDTVSLDLAFDAQTSGGLLLAVPKNRVEECISRLEDAGELAAQVGEVTGESEGSLNII